MDQYYSIIIHLLYYYIACYRFVCTNRGFVNNLYYSYASILYFLGYIFICKKLFAIPVNKEGLQIDTNDLFSCCLEHDRLGFPFELLTVP